jgi:DNA-binding MarR family transcriptional regulator
MRQLWGVAHGLQSRSKRMEAELGITGPQRLVIRILGQAPGTTAGAIARSMCVHPSTLTGVLRRLEARGIVKRARDDADARRSLLELTAEGKKLNRKKSGTVELAVERALERASSSQIAATREVLTLIIEELERDDR